MTETERSITDGQTAQNAKKFADMAKERDEKIHAKKLLSLAMRAQHSSKINILDDFAVDELKKVAEGAKTDENELASVQNSV